MDKFDHYLALDWAQSNMAVAHMTKHSSEIDTIDVRSDIEALKLYLAGYKGTKILTFEETSPAHWLYTELIEHVDEIIVCEPYSNHLLKTGPKNDRVDAIKLVRLLRAEMLKPVFHCTDDFVKVRKLVSGFEDLTHALVQLKNRRSAMYRAVGKKVSSTLEGFSEEERFVLEGIDHLIEAHEQQRLKYIAQFRRLHKENKMVRDLSSIPGIGRINSIKIAATVIDAKRFKHTTAFWLYSGLQKYELISGGKSYGKRSPRYSRKLKCVFKTAALVCSRTASSDHPLKRYYTELIEIRKYHEHQARHALARRIATLALGVMKTGEPLNVDLLNKKELAG